MGRLLHWLDAKAFNWLQENCGSLPVRFQKWLAWHYPDARVRKKCWGLLNVEMGEGTFANPGLLVVNTAEPDGKVTIGRNVSIAPGVILVTDSAPTNSPFLMAHPAVQRDLVKRAPIVIDDDVWLGAGAIILPGVTIGRGAVVGAGALVLADVDPMTVVAGVPARLTRSLDGVQ